MRLAHLLIVLFIGLKLAKIIDWSWWLVLSPFWIGFSLHFIERMLLERLKREEKKTEDAFERLRRKLNQSTDQ